MTEEDFTPQQSDDPASGVSVLSDSGSGGWVAPDLKAEASAGTTPQVTTAGHFGAERGDVWDWTGWDHLAGDPADDARFWLFQGYGTGTCAATAVGMVIADLMGVPAQSNEEVVNRAYSLGVISYDPANPDWARWGGWSGMTTDGTEALLEFYGVATSVYYGATVDDLVAYLDADHAVLLTLDSSEVLHGIDDDATPGGFSADHTVQITGIDTENRVVYLNDPGLAYGAGLAIGLDQFAAAWADGGNTMVATDRPMETREPAESTEPTQPTERPADETLYAGEAGTVVLPFTLRCHEGAWMVPSDNGEVP